MDEPRQTAADAVKMVLVYASLGLSMGGLSYVLHPEGGSEQIRMMVATYLVFLLYVVFDFRLPVRNKYHNMLITCCYVVVALVGLLVVEATAPDYTPSAIGVLFVLYYALGIGLSWYRVR